MKRVVMIGTVAALAILPALLMAQTAPAGRGNAGHSPVLREIHGRRPAHRQARPGTGYGSSGLSRADACALSQDDGRHGHHHRQRPGHPWAVALLPSGRFLITEKPGRLRILNKDGSALHTITANMPPVYFRGQAGLLDVALDRNFASNHRIFFVYMRTGRCRHVRPG